MRGAAMAGTAVDNTNDEPARRSEPGFGFSVLGSGPGFELSFRGSYLRFPVRGSGLGGVRVLGSEFGLSVRCPRFFRFVATVWALG